MTHSGKISKSNQEYIFHNINQRLAPISYFLIMLSWKAARCICLTTSMWSQKCPPTGEQDVLPPYGGMNISQQRKGTWYGADPSHHGRPRTRYAKWKKPVTNGHRLYDSMCAKYTELANSQRQNTDPWLSGAGVREVATGCRVPFWSDENVLKLDCGEVAELYAEKCWIAHFRGMNFVACDYVSTNLFLKKRKVSGWTWSLVDRTPSEGFLHK